MSVLLFLTLLYVAILVVALTVGLIAIAYFLHGTRANLAHIAGGLQQADQHVEPLTLTWGWRNLSSIRITRRGLGSPM